MTSKKITHDFRPGKSGLRKVLGDTEAEIIELVWEMGHVKVRDIYKAINMNRDVAYTTVMTVMRRLADKKLLGRIDTGKSYEYYSLITREELVNIMVAEVIDGLWDEYADLVHAYLEKRFNNLDQPVKGKKYTLARRFNSEKTR